MKHLAIASSIAGNPSADRHKRVDRVNLKQILTSYTEVFGIVTFVVTKPTVNGGHHHLPYFSSAFDNKYV